MTLLFAAVSYLFVHMVESYSKMLMLIMVRLTTVFPMVLGVTVSISYTVGNGLGLSRARGASAKHGLSPNNNASFHLPLLLRDLNN